MTHHFALLNIHSSLGFTGIFTLYSSYSHLKIVCQIFLRGASGRRISLFQKPLQLLSKNASFLSTKSFEDLPSSYYFHFLTSVTTLKGSLNKFQTEFDIIPSKTSKQLNSWAWRILMKTLNCATVTLKSDCKSCRVIGRSLKWFYMILLSQTNFLKFLAE